MDAFGPGSGSARKDSTGPCSWREEGCRRTCTYFVALFRDRADWQELFPPEGVTFEGIQITGARERSCGRGDLTPPNLGQPRDGVEPPPWRSPRAKVSRRADVIVVSEDPLMRIAALGEPSTIPRVRKGGHLEVLRPAEP
jgi:hypothetical protein